MTAEVVIVGAGPAGMAAACALAECGVAARVVDEQVAAGGQVYRAVERVAGAMPGRANILGKDYLSGLPLARRMRDCDTEFSPETSVWDIAGGSAPRLGLLRDGRAELVNPRHILIATGAMERPMPFPGWTLPGVLGVGGAQVLLKESGLVPTDHVVIAGTGPLVYLFAVQLLRAGQAPAAILDTGGRLPGRAHWGRLAQVAMTRPSALLQGNKWLREIRQSGTRHVFGVQRWQAEGTGRVEAISWWGRDGMETLDCELLLVHDGVIPNVHLSMAAGCRHRWNAVQHCWVPETNAAGYSSEEGVSIAGDSAGILGADAAILSGRITGLDVARRLGRLDQERWRAEFESANASLERLRPLRRFLDHWYRPAEWLREPGDDTVICRCEEVTAGELREVARRGCMGPNQAKAFTRCGMGPCMGRYCGNAVSQVLARCHGTSVADIGHYRIRPPVKPITVAQLAAMQTAGNPASG